MYATASGNRRFELGDPYGRPAALAAPDPPPRHVEINRKERRKAARERLKQLRADLQTAQSAAERIRAEEPRLPDFAAMTVGEKQVAETQFRERLWIFRHTVLGSAINRAQTIEREIRQTILELKRTWDPALAGELFDLRGQANLLSARIAHWQIVRDEIHEIEQLRKDTDRWSDGILSEAERVCLTHSLLKGQPVVDPEAHLRRFMPGRLEMYHEREAAENRRKLGRLYAAGMQRLRFLERRAAVHARGAEELVRAERQLSEVQAAIAKLEKKQLTDP